LKAKEVIVGKDK